MDKVDNDCCVLCAGLGLRVIFFVIGDSVVFEGCGGGS